MKVSLTYTLEIPHKHKRHFYLSVLLQNLHTFLPAMRSSSNVLCTAKGVLFTFLFSKFPLKSVVPLIHHNIINMIIMIIHIIIQLGLGLGPTLRSFIMGLFLVILIVMLPQTI